MKKDTILIVLVVLLSVACLSLGGYILLDKKNDTVESKKPAEDAREVVATEESIKKLAEDKSLMIDDDFSKKKFFGHMSPYSEEYTQNIFGDDKDFYFILDNGKLYISIKEYKSLVTDIEDEIVSMQRVKGGVEDASGHDFLVLTKYGDLYRLVNPIRAKDSWHNKQTFLKISKNESVELGFEKINKDVKILALTNYLHEVETYEDVDFHVYMGTVYGNDHNYYTADEFKKVEKQN